MIIKVCGMRDRASLQSIVELPVDALGFIFYPGSSRYVGDDPALADDLKVLLPRAMVRIGVFVNEKPEVILALSQQFRLDGLQLHGDETPEELQLVVHVFQESGMRLPFLIKAFSIGNTATFPHTAPYADLCRYFLFDTAGPAPGGNGVAFSWNLLHQYKGDTPFFLAGGIGPEHVQDILDLDHPKLAGVDLNSRFETAPGKKNIDELARFLIHLNPVPCQP